MEKKIRVTGSSQRNFISINLIYTRCLDLASSWTVTYEGFTMCSCPLHALYETNVIPILQMKRKRLQRKYFPKVKRPAWAELGLEPRSHRLQH